MGHPSIATMSIFAKNLGISIHVSNKSAACDACFWAKQTRTQFKISDIKPDDLFELVHCDIWGPHREPSSCRAHYFLILVDDASCGVWLHLMKEKSEAGPLLRGFITMVQNQFAKQVKVVRTDNGNDFKYASMK